MNDDLETQLAGLRRRPLPAEWKARILADAKTAAPKTRNSIASIFMPPKWLAWGMAAAWLMIGLFNGLTPVPPSRTTFAQSPPVPTINAPSLAQQQRLIASLMNDSSFSQP